MGRLNKKLSKKVSVKSKVTTGLSSSAAKALLSAKDVLSMPTDTSKSAAAPVESFSSLVAKSKSAQSHLDRSANSANSSPSQNARNNKKRFKTVQREGKIVKLKKKEKMKLRTDNLVNKLKGIEKEKKEKLEKKQREKIVIVKDTKPLLDNLLEIENQIEKEIEQKEKKLKSGIKKPSKHTLKQKKQKDQFMKDIEFLKAASKHPEYVKNPIEIISTHIQNTVN